MTDSHIVFGSWKLRHNEPTKPDERRLILHPLPEDGRCEDVSILLDLRRRSRPTYIYEPGTLIAADAAEETLSNLSADLVPLAVVRFRGGELELTHLLTRVEIQITHLLRVDGLPARIASATLDQDLRSHFERAHIRLNNFECYYIKGMPDTELEQKFDITAPYDYLEASRRFYAELEEGAITGFRPQLGDEIQPWSYDNNFCSILPNEQGIGGYVSIMHWSRKKKESWDEPVVTFKKKMFKEDALERWERNYHNQRIEGTPEEALAAYFKLPLARLPEWRRTRFDIACECVATGNVFMINLEDSRVFDDRTPEGRLQQCEIEYLKTRGVPDEKAIYADFEALSREVERFMERFGLSFTRSNYSKLTFLNEYIARRRPGSSA